MIKTSQSAREKVDNYCKKNSIETLYMFSISHVTNGLDILNDQHYDINKSFVYFSNRLKLREHTTLLSSFIS